MSEQQLHTKIDKMAETITKTSTNVEWLIKETVRINGTFTNHVKSSEKYRAAVDRNIGWRHALKFIVPIIIIILGWIIMSS